MNKTGKKRGTRLIAGVIGVALTLTALSGCALVNVNPKRDNAQTIATVKGKAVKKSLFNNTMVSTEIYQTASGGSMPTGSELEELKNNVLDGIVQTEVLAQKAKDDGAKVNEKNARKTGLSTYKAVKKQAAKRYHTILSTYNTTDKAFKAYMQDYSVDTAYADKAQSAFDKKLAKNPDKYISRSVGKVNGETVDYQTYYYYYVEAYLSAYIKAQQNGSDLSSTSAQEAIQEDAMKDLAYDRNLIDYAKEHSIKVSDSAVKTAEAALKSQDSLYFSKASDLDSFLSQMAEGITHKEFYAARKQAARADAARSAIRANIKKGVKVSDNEIETYYNNHKRDYDASTVSAEHILTTKKALADKIAKEAKKCKTKADFDKLMKKYPQSTKKGILESSDLGPFKYSAMVKSFSKAAFSAKKNTATGPVKTTYGYHVIFVYDKKTVKGDTWQKHKKAIKNTLANQKTKTEFAKVKKNLKKDPKIKIDKTIKTPTDHYVDSLKKSMNVKVYDKRI